MQEFRPSWVEISRAALCANLRVVQQAVPAGTGVLAMIKADAYGHGAIHCAQWLIDAGATALGVATVEEGIELRDAGIAAPVLVLGSCAGQTDAVVEAIVAHRLTPVVHEATTMTRLARAVAQRGAAPLACHLKIDTGMHRMGCAPEHVPELLLAIAATPQLHLAGVMTHYAASDDPAASAEQLAQFAPLLPACRAAMRAPLWHLANSGAILQAPAQPQLVRPGGVSPADALWVRPGIMLYGAAPYAGAPGADALQPVMTMKSHVMHQQRIAVGERVSYGGVWRAARPSTIAVIPLGYADGYPWNAVGCASCLIQGQAVPIVGRITMDMIMADVTDRPGVQIGDEVVLLGRQGAARISAEQLAGWADTIAYDIVCRVSKRMPRHYVE